MRWWFLHTPPLSGTVNMAVDEALMLRARSTGEGVVRVYSWLAPTLSLGRNQTARGAWDPARARELGVGIVRRLTGGRAVLHAREVTYSVTAPAAEGRDLRADYDAINRLLLTALRALGAKVELARVEGRTPRPGSAPCFERPSAGELVFAGRKLVGSAQVREGGAFLQHGSMLAHDDQGRLAEVATRPVPLTPAATLTEVMARPVAVGEVADVLRHTVRACWDPGAANLDADAILAAAVAFEERYTSDAWTWRR